MDGQTKRQKERKRETERYRDWQTGRKTERKRGRQKGRKTERQKDIWLGGKETDRWTDVPTDRLPDRWLRCSEWRPRHSCTSLHWWTPTDRFEPTSKPTKKSLSYFVLLPVL
jgi:hypothetical protein